MRTTGYPMTWRRVVNRNGLGDGDYDRPPTKFGYDERFFDAEFASALNRDDTVLSRAPLWAEHIKAVNAGLRLLAGDLRRMERDVADEQYICKEIARRTGVDVDTVAAVIKEFMDV